ncbi:type II secretion system protein GspL [Colwellia psychrerythraea]|uniref:General secretion pathway protein L n=1 Tax=Colwellia psychrerythraea TaxID=28229 RepID=A0A099KPE1_COLPS|nr:type II secretion system protein GspL [Colwellia psychrerythraea]KGJ92381.1 general secretion pathway protein L [Colwellia psychrerythraea]
MTETLFIRLGSQAHDIIHWLVVSEINSNEQEIIASGELKGAEQLSELTDKAERRQVKVLVPGCDVLLKSLNVPAKSSRAMRLAVPYMLEDNLAEEVEQLFFAYADLKSDIQGNNCFTAIVAHKQMQQWLLWLAEAGIETLFILPDVLAMPFMDGGWSAIAIGDTCTEQVIVRQHNWQGFVLDTNIWQLQWQAFNAEQTADEQKDGEQPYKSVAIEAYSQLAHSDSLTVTQMPEELPLALMAKNYGSQLNRFNLLQGQYKIKESRNNVSKQWLWVAGVALFALLLNLSHKGAQLWQLNAEQDKVQQSIISEYKKAFPKTKRVRVSTIKSQLNRELALLGGVSDQQGFLAMLARVQPAFAKVPALKPETLKFDGKRQELRIQATAKDYQAFELFNVALATANLTVKQGSQNNQGDLVTGSFSISNKTANKTTNKTKSKRKGTAKQRSNKNNKETS